jgi:hypothetical protein
MMGMSIDSMVMRLAKTHDDEAAASELVRRSSPPCEQTALHRGRRGVDMWSRRVHA